MKKKTKCNLVSIVCFKLVSGQKESKKIYNYFGCLYKHRCFSRLFD